MYILSENECILKRPWWRQTHTFSIKDDELLEKYNEIWKKVKNSLKKEFDIEPGYNEK